MAKSAKMKQNWGAFVFQLLGSIVFLWVVFSGIAGWTGGGIFAGGGAFWSPFFVGAAVIASVSLLLISLGEVTGWRGPRLGIMGLETSAVAGVTLAALTWTNSNLLWLSVAGFVLTFIGAAMGGR